MTFSLKTAAIIQRRAALVGVCAVIGALAAWAVTLIQDPEYSVRAVVTVPVFDVSDTGGDPETADGAELGRPLDASRLALTYASLIVEDDSILDYVAEQTGQDPEVIADSIDVINTSETPLIEIVVVSDTADAAGDMLRAFIDAIVGDAPVSTSIARNSIQPVRIEEPVASTSAGVLPAVPAGFLLGALISSVVAIYWERSRPRLDTSTEVSSLLGLPSRDLPNLAERFGSWVIKRWAELAGPSATVLVVAISPVERASVPVAIRELTDSLDVAEVDPFRGDAVADGDAQNRPDSEITPDMELTVPSAGGAGPGRLLIRSTNEPGHPGGFDPGVNQPGLVVIAIQRGTPVESVVETIDELESAGLNPGYAILID